jgi:hypothetical protein
MILYRSLLPLRLLTVGALCGNMSFAVCLSVPAQEAAKETPGYNWTLQYKKGETVRYRQSIVISYPDARGKNATYSVTSVNKREVKAITDAGDTTLRETTEAQAIVDNGHTIPDNPENHSILLLTVNKQGVVLKEDLEKREALESTRSDTDRGMAIMMMAYSRPAPDKAVKTGDTWKTEIDNRLVEGKKVTLTSTFVGKEKIFGVDTLKIKLRMDIPTVVDADAKKTLKIESTYNVDPQTGHLIRDNFTFENMEVPSFHGIVLAKLSGQIAQVVPGVNDKDLPTEQQAGSTLHE